MDLLPGAPRPRGAMRRSRPPSPTPPSRSFRSKARWPPSGRTSSNSTQVKPDDDFFELGGDSLSAVQILSRVTRRFNYKVSEVELFTARTVRGLAQVIQQAVVGTTGGGPQLAPVDGPRTRFPATAAQRRLWILDHILPNPEVYNVGFLVRIQGQIDVEALRAAFEQVERRHEALRVHFETEDGLPVQVVGEPRRVELPFVDLRDKPEAERRTIATAESTACLSARIPLTADRLYRVKLYRTGTDEFLLWLNMHHTITDGWSWGVFFKDLEAYYEAAKSGNPPKVRPLPVQYGDYSVWEAALRKTAAFRDQVDYWKKVLAPPVPTLDLPFARPRPVWQTFKGAVVKFDLPKKLVGGGGPAGAAGVGHPVHGRAGRLSGGLAPIHGSG